MNPFGKFRSLFNRRKLDADMAEEMRLHLERRTEENIASGMSPEDARYAALRKFGGVDHVKERCRDLRGWPSLEQLVADIRFSMRSLNRAPGFTVAMIVTLALGIGAAVTVFTVTADPLFRKGPYPNSSELLAIGWKDKWTPFGLDLNGVQLLAYQEQTNVFAGYAAIEGRMANVVIEGEPAPANRVAISIDAFSTMGIVPALGRGFLLEEYRSGSDNVVVITDDFWRTRLHADPAVLGREILIDQQPCKVVGVLRPGQLIPFRFQGDVYRPLFFNLSPQDRFGPGIHVVGRLRPGVSPEAARAALAAVRFPTLPQIQTSSIPEREPVVMPVNATGGRAMWWVLFTGGAFLFAISCLNAMNLMLVRVLGRSRELSIRLAVGCSRPRLARLLMIESAALTLAVGLVVLLVARGWFHPLFALLYSNPALRYEAFSEWITVGGTAALCLIAGVVVVSVPIWQVVRADASNGLKAGGASAGETRSMRRLRNFLVALQAALAVVLLVGTGLMMQTMQKLQAVDLGFDPAGRVKVWLEFPRGSAPKPGAWADYFERLSRRVAAIPGVRSVSLGEALLIGQFWTRENLQMKDGTSQRVAESYVSGGYVATAGMRLKRGRWFSGRSGESEIVINETLARTLYGDENPLGREIMHRGSGNRGYQVVGVVRDVKEMLRAPSGPRLYLPAWVAPTMSGSLLLRLDRDPQAEFKSVVRRAIYDFDPMVITNYVGSIQETIEGSMGAERFTFLILQGLAVIALGLAIIGLFSVMAYSVGARTREFGVRSALGAVPAHLYRLVLIRGLATVALGVLAGIAVAIGATRALQGLLFETTTYDPVVYATVAGVLLLSGALACWLPARRAAKVDPMVALRAE
jgi:predicted permease